MVTWSLSMCKATINQFWADNPTPGAQEGMKELLQVVIHSMRNTSKSWFVLQECGLTLEGVLVSLIISRA